MLPGDTSEHDAFGKRTAAEAACTVNTTTHLICGKEAGDRFMIEIDDLCFWVNG
jgi:hypothetical protein